MAAPTQAEDAGSVQLEGSGFELAPRRSKRSVFLHSGVRICPKESLSEVLANHQAYYQLRGTYCGGGVFEGWGWVDGGAPACEELKEKRDYFISNTV